MAEKEEKTPCTNLILYQTIGKNTNLWGFIREDIARLPRLTMMLVHQVGWNHSAERAVEVMKRYIVDLPVIPTQKGVFVTMNRNDRLAGCLGTFAGRDGNLLEKIMAYTLKSAFEDHRFHDHPLRSGRGVKELYEGEREREGGKWTFTTTLLDVGVEVEGEKFWERYQPGGHGIVLGWGGRSATFLPKVMVRWWPEGVGLDEELSYDQRQDFEYEVFGALLHKMGHSSVSPKRWKEGNVELYVGTEYNDD